MSTKFKPQYFAALNKDTTPQDISFALSEWLESLETELLVLASLVGTDEIVLNLASGMLHAYESALMRNVLICGCSPADVDEICSDLQSGFKEGSESITSVARELGHAMDYNNSPLAGARLRGSLLRPGQFSVEAAKYLEQWRMGGEESSRDVLSNVCKMLVGIAPTTPIKH